MAEKKIPFTPSQLTEIIRQYPTPFHIYDEAAIRQNVRNLLAAFAWAPQFKEYFAVKATPNPSILKVLREEGVGADCSSLAELILAQRSGIVGENIMFSSNDTPDEDFKKARELGAIINLDDISHIEFLEKHAGIPDVISFRYNPGPLMQSGNTIIGFPEQANYGLTHGTTFPKAASLAEQTPDYAAIARAYGCDGVRIGSAADFRPALEAAIASGRPTVLDVAMVNNPTPTSGHWNILDIYAPQGNAGHVSTD